MSDESTRFDVAFRPLARADFEQLRDWLNTPQVSEWWGREWGGPDGLGGAGPDAATVEEVAEQYLPDLEPHDPSHPFVIVADGRDVGLIQWYRLRDYPDYERELGEAGTGAAGVDLFVGEPDLVGRGLGSLVIRRFVDDVVLAAGVTRCIGAPDVRNLRSIRAFEKAGFEWVRDAAVTGEPAPEHVMVRSSPRPGTTPSTDP